MTVLTRWKDRKITLKRRVVSRDNPAEITSERTLVGKVCVHKAAYCHGATRLGAGVERRYWFTDDNTGSNYRLPANGRMRVYAEGKDTLVLRVYD